VAGRRRWSARAWAGLYQLYRLRALGLRTRVDRGPARGVGGNLVLETATPGPRRCDVESLSYSYSFSPGARAGVDLE